MPEINATPLQRWTSLAQQITVELTLLVGAAPRRGLPLITAVGAALLVCGGPFTMRAAAAGPGGGWPQYRGDAAESGHAVWQSPTAPGATLAWRFTIGDGAMIDASPVVSPDGTVYVGARVPGSGPVAWPHWELFAINPDGTEKWSRALPRDAIGWYQLRAAPLIRADGSLVVLGHFDEPVYKPDGSLDSWRARQRLFLIGPDGAIRRSTPEFDGYGLSAPGLDPDGRVYYWDAWHNGLVKLDDTLGFVPVAGLTGDFRGSFDMCSIWPFCVDESGGQGRDPARVPVWPLRGSAAYSRECNELVASDSAGSVFKVVRARPFGGGSTEREIDGPALTPAIGTGGRAYLATLKTEHPSLEAWDQDGVRWTTELGGYPTAPPAVGHSGHALADVTVQCLWLEGYGGSQVRRFHTLDDEIYVPVSDDYLYAFDARGNLRWKVPYNSGHAGAPVVIDLANREQLVLSAQEQALWAFAHDDGTPLWYVPLDSPSLGSPAVANDTIYVASQTSVYAIGRPDAVVTQPGEPDREPAPLPAVDSPVQ